MKLKFGLTTLVVASLAATALIYHRWPVNLRDESKSVRPQFRAKADQITSRMALSTRAPGLSAPPVEAGAPTDTAKAESSEPNGLSALLASKTSKLTAAQVEPYLNANRRSAASLLAAFRTTDDPALLEEAMQKYPKSPQVAFEAAFRKDASPAERRQWLDAFKQSAPDNALPNYFSALNYFKAGQTDQAVQDLVAASGKKQFQDYSRDRTQDDEEAYLTAGRSVGDAKLAATVNLRLPHLAQVKELSRSIVDLANSYQQAGDEASRQSALQMAANLGRRFGDGSTGESLISQLVGISAERTALHAMDPNSPYGANNQTVQDRIGQLTQQRAAIQELNKQAEPLWQTMSEQDWASYLGRSQVFGEQNALNWLVSKYGPK